MTRLPWTGPAVMLALLAGCDRPAGQSAANARGPAAAQVERAGPAHWNATTGGFELDGKPVKTVKLWTFDGSTEGFATLRSKIVPADGQGLAVTIVDPILRSPKGLNVPGARFSLVLVRLTRTAAGAGWDGALYYSTANHPESIAYLGKPMSGANPAVNETTTLVYDMRRQTLGAPDWTESTIDQIRLDIEDKAGGAFVIRQIAIAENPDSRPPPALPLATPPEATPPAPTQKP
ncbi:hypothetical protein [Phenylobacterium sp.]|uniref:hypothetical protein n=1 Tax=Phenylobacterium sp. TaxID=1871053 RepID=UPI00286A450F|nr:hypothetical protein [Phenylobacterium sp.]